MIKALKKAEETDEYVVRVYETEGRKAQSATLTFAGEIISASEANGTEKTIGNATFEGNKLQVNITPYSVELTKYASNHRDVRRLRSNMPLYRLTTTANVLLIMNSVEKAISNRAILLQPNFCRTH